MTSDSSPSVVNHRTSRIDALSGRLTLHIAEESVIQPESVAQSLGIFAFFPLLPVEPPEIHALLFERTDDRVEIGVCPILIVYSERNRSLGTIRINVILRSVIRRSPRKIIFYESVVWLFIRLDA